MWGKKIKRRATKLKAGSLKTNTPLSKIRK